MSFKTHDFHPPHLVTEIVCNLPHVKRTPTHKFIYFAAQVIVFHYVCKGGKLTKKEFEELNYKYS